MKKTLLLLTLFLGNSFLFAQQDPVILHNGGAIDDRFEFPVPADQPDVYYDTVNQEIIIDGTGEVTYDDVEIASVSTWTVVISTQVSGYYDTIDVSSLPTGEYCITIDSPTGNSFEGFFDTY